MSTPSPDATDGTSGTSALDLTKKVDDQSQVETGEDVAADANEGIQSVLSIVQEASDEAEEVSEKVERVPHTSESVIAKISTFTKAAHLAKLVQSAVKDKVFFKEHGVPYTEEGALSPNPEVEGSQAAIDAVLEARVKLAPADAPKKKKKNVVNTGPKKKKAPKAKEKTVTREAFLSACSKKIPTLDTPRPLRLLANVLVGQGVLRVVTAKNGYDWTVEAIDGVDESAAFVADISEKLADNQFQVLGIVEEIEGVKNHNVLKFFAYNAKERGLINIDGKTGEMTAVEGVEGSEGLVTIFLDVREKLNVKEKNAQIVTMRAKASKAKSEEGVMKLAYAAARNGLVRNTGNDLMAVNGLDGSQELADELKAAREGFEKKVLTNKSLASALSKIQGL